MVSRTCGESEYSLENSAAIITIANLIEDGDEPTHNDIQAALAIYHGTLQPDKLLDEARRYYLSYLHYYHDEPNV